MQRAANAYQSGDWTAAEQFCRQALNVQADYFDALNLLGIIAAQSRRLQEAADLLSRAVLINPDNVFAHLNCGNALRDLKRLEAALASYDRAIELKPDYEKAHYSRGNVLLELQRPEAALASYDRAIELKPDYAEAHNNRGVVLWGLGKTEEALASYDHAIWIKPDHAEAHNNRGNALKKLNRLQEALASYDHAFELKPDYAEACNNRGAVLRELKRLEEALASYDRAIALKPDYVEAHSNRGNVLGDLGNFEQALASYQRALELKPDYAEAQNNRGNTLQELNRFTEALASYDRAIALKPGYAEAHSNRGGILKQLGRMEEALASYGQAIGFKPDYAEAYSNRGNLLKDLQRLDEALASHDKAIALKPDSAESQTNRGATLQELRRLDEALACYDKAIALTPDFAQAHSNRGVTLQALRRLNEALSSYDRAIALKPDHVESYSNRGNMLQELRRFDAAMADYIHAIEIDPDYAEGHLNLALCRLLTGDFDHGWQGYEWRWKRNTFGSPKNDYTQPLWLGVEPLPGKTILLHCEQGLGDTLQFCRYAGMVSDLGANVILGVQKPLVALLENLQGVSRLVTHGSVMPPLDYQCPLLSLPLAFKTRLDTIPSSTRYLSSDKNRVAQWQTRLGRKTKPRVGLVWSGSTKHKNDHNRSLALQDIVRYLPPQLEYVSLQKELREPDQAVLSAHTGIRHVGDELIDFSDTAALVELMDIVVSVDTSVAHLAAAMGRPVWILLPFNPDWRWLLDREDSPWYPTARLFRQPALDDWTAVLEKLERELRNASWETSADPAVTRKKARPPHPARAIRGRVAGLNIPQTMQQAVAAYQQNNWCETERLCRQVLAAKADYFDALNLLGIIAAQSRRLPEALDLLSRAVAINPDNPFTHFNRANILKDLKRPEKSLAGYDCAIALKPDYDRAHYSRGNVLLELKRFEEALASYDRAIELKPGSESTYYNRSHALLELGRPAEALAGYDCALALKPDYVEAHNNRGFVLWTLGKASEALASYDRAIELNPDYVEAHNNRGNALKKLNRLQEALASYDRAIELKPDYAEAHNNRGAVLRELNRVEEALTSYDRAIELKPDYVEAHSNCGNVLGDLGDFERALASYQRALELKPDYAETHNNRGNALQELNRFAEALESYGRAIALKPDYAEAHSNRGSVLRKLERAADALASYERAIKLKPDYAEAHSNQGNLLLDLQNPEAAAACFRRALDIAPDHEFLFGNWLHARAKVCDWKDWERDTSALKDKIGLGKKTASPFPVLALTGSLPLQRKAAETWMQEKHPVSHALPPIARRARHDRIRIGYFSADYHNHATAYLMAELFEKHDRSKFELAAFSFGPNKSDDMRQRIVAAFDKFIDVRNQSDREVALLARRLEIDIAVDLKGFTQDCRPGIFSLRAAPVQVNYLGYPGTMGNEYIDYLIADPVVIPQAEQSHYSEKIAYLPHSYQVNDAKRLISDKVFTRESLGLPDAGFVFCCFNNNFKITPGTFDGWMRILERVEGSVLWLLSDNTAAERNLRQHAVQRGITAERLVFAKRLPLAEHLARHRAADLFIDTLPYNAHTTASDALWAGLPVLTCAGESFASRVAASLLTAIQLPELITTTQEQYESLVIELATHPARLQQIRQKLAHNRLTTPLFDTSLFTRHIENAYTRMVERYHADLPPDHIYVPA